jgi:DNA-binding NtrC family response regulator
MRGEPVQVLAAASAQCREQLRRIMSHSRWALREASGLAEAAALLDRQPRAVVICEEILPDGSWRDVLAHTSLLAVPLPVIVVSNRADDRMWMEVLDRGGYNLLEMPLPEQELFRIVSNAWRYLRERSSLTGRAGSQ